MRRCQSPTLWLFTSSKQRPNSAFGSSKLMYGFVPIKLVGTGQQIQNHIYFHPGSTIGTPYSVHTGWQSNPSTTDSGALLYQHRHQHHAHQVPADTSTVMTSSSSLGSADRKRIRDPSDTSNAPIDQANLNQTNPFLYQNYNQLQYQQYHIVEHPPMMTATSAPYTNEDRRKRPKNDDNGTTVTSPNYRAKARNTAAQLFNQVVKNNDHSHQPPPQAYYNQQHQQQYNNQYHNSHIPYNTGNSNHPHAIPPPLSIPTAPPLPVANFTGRRILRGMQKAASPPISVTPPLVTPTTTYGSSTTLNALVSESKSYTYDEDEFYDEDDEGPIDDDDSDDGEYVGQLPPMVTPTATNTTATVSNNNTGRGSKRKAPATRTPRVEVTIPTSGNDGRSRALNAVKNAVKTCARLTNDYDLTHILGWGHNGVVLLGSQQNFLSSRRKKVAIKLIYKRGDAISRLGTNPPSEITMLQGLNHPSIVQYLSHWEDRTVWYLVQEFVGPSTIRGQEYLTCALPSHGNSSNSDDEEHIRLTIANDSGSDLWVLNNQYHRKRREAAAESAVPHSQVEGMPPSLRQKLFYQIASAVAYLHANNVVHADIKEENIVVTSTLQRPKCKLTDFGHAFHTNGTPRLKYHSTSRLSAPECWVNVNRRNEGKQYVELFEGKKQDTWSLGLVLFSMIHGGLPSDHDQLVNGEKPMQKDHYPAVSRLQKIATPEELTLLKRMLAINEKKRVGMDEVMQDVYITSKSTTTTKASGSSSSGTMKRRG
ncbi:hypothetical protein SeLEV6574_g03258 [Synchytrium endobioticum]|uniref:Protein kinase domain-containing protein n=1 Tax=Synchytrium endobioticum TaxID=286115 RepID=A0A507D532_9FUNG|nr:hypothetical protein SeLEV6574_g03258 [Synchytrium endobioticum]